MNRWITLFSLFILGAVNLSVAQVISDGTKPISIDLSEQYEVSIKLSDSLINYEALLVETAWKNSAIRIIDEKNIESTGKEVLMAKYSWLNHINAAGNLNEITINPSNTNLIGNQFPRYNFGVAINLGMFVETPLQVKMSKLSQEKQVEQLRADRITLKAEVLRRYQTYLLAQQVMALVENNLSNATLRFSTDEVAFENGNMSVQEYNNSQNSLSASKVKYLQAKNDVMMAKISLEEILGTNIESIQKN